MELLLHQLAELPMSAASGVVLWAGRLWLVADDEISLASCALDGSGGCDHALPLPALPEAHAARKAQKPDHEALCVGPDGALYALGSGSTATHARGAAPQLVELRPLYEALLRELPELNVEAAAWTGPHLLLLSRGNGARRDNALIRLDAGVALERLQLNGELAPDALREIVRVPLGELLGAPLGFTDATPHPDGGLLFTAAAEASPDTYQDGTCTGSIVGTLSDAGVVGAIATALPAHKLEGLCVVAQDGDALELRLVADPDDRALRAPLLGASWPRRL